MKTILAVLVIILANVTASGQWQKNNEKVEDTAERKSLNGFGGHLVMAKDPQGFIKEWQKPEMPKIDVVSEVKRGELVGAFVLFVGCKPDSSGVCNAEIDYVVLKPDGSVYAERKAQPLWKEQAPPTGNIQLSRAILAIRMQSKDPTGVYKVKAKLSDLNANITLELETTFRAK